MTEYTFSRKQTFLLDLLKLFSFPSLKNKIEVFLMVGGEGGGGLMVFIHQNVTLVFRLSGLQQKPLKTAQHFLQKI